MKEVTFLKKLGIKTNCIPRLVITIFLLLFAIESYGQIPLPPEERCTSKDLEVVGARLDLETCFQCEIGGATVPVSLILAINNTTGSFRPTFFFSGVLEETDANGNVTSIPITDCNDSEGLPSNTITELTFLDINYTCGSTYLLKDLYLAWTDASAVLDANGNVDDTAKNSCANLTTKTTKIQGQDVLDISPKCGTVPAIEITTPLTGSPQFTDLTCNDDNGPSNDGTATALASGGKAPYTYSWDDPNAQTTSTAVGLAAGNYKCTITDSDNCTFDVFATISDALAFSASATPTDVTCNDDDGNASDGSIAVDVTNGVAPLSFSWTGPDGFTASTEDLTGLSAAGTYNLTITDDNGCTATASAEIAVPLAFSASATPTDVTCNDDDGNASDGSIAVDVTNGVAPLSFSWTGPDGFTASTEDLTGLSAAGTYNLTITDDNGCTATASAEIAVPLAFSASATPTDVTCNDDDGNASDGSIAVDVTNGVAPLSFSWTGPDGFTASTEDLTGLSAAGTYNLTITDDNGCTATASAEIAVPLAFSASATPTDVTCNDDDGNASDGSIAVDVTNGVAPLSFSWTGPDGFTASTEDLTGLSAAGTYNLTITDDNGCTATASAEIAVPLAFSASATPTDVTCNDDDGNASDGSIAVDVTNGVAPLSFSWTGPDGFTASTEDLTGLSAAGTYNLTITDDNGCTATASAEIAVPLAFSASATPTDVTCNDDDGNASDGSIAVDVTNGVAPLSFSWTGPDGFTASTEDLTGLSAAGTYNLTITDDNGCTATASAEIAVPLAFSASATPTDVTCNDDDGNASDGSIAVDVTNGVAPLSFSWTGPDGFTASTEDLTGLSAAGTYNLTITDDNGCTATASAEIAVPLAFSASATPTDVTCNDDDGNASDGSIAVDVTNGVAPLSFSWTGPDGFTASTEDLTGLSAAGTYYLTITDDNGCTATASAEIAVPLAFSASATPTDVTCNDDDGNASDGSIAVDVTNGVAPLSFSWTGPDGFTASTEDLTGLSAAGTYNLTITDDNGCTTTASAEIAVPLAFSASATPTDVTCNDDDGNASDGSIAVDVTNGIVAPLSLSGHV